MKGGSNKENAAKWYIHVLYNKIDALIFIVSFVIVLQSTIKPIRKSCKYYQTLLVHVKPIYHLLLLTI